MLSSQPRASMARRPWPCAGSEGRTLKDRAIRESAGTFLNRHRKPANVGSLRTGLLFLKANSGDSAARVVPEKPPQPFRRPMASILPLR